MNKLQKQVLCSLLGSAILMGMPAASSAEETGSQEFSLDEYVVTASRVPVKQNEIAATVTVITRDEIERSGFTDVPDILKKNNINMEYTRSAAVPVLNGDDRVLILVDGRKMGWNHLIISGNDHAGFNPNLLGVDNIERIEIVRGPASSLYGSEAVGGVINIITRKANSTQTTASTEFGSWGSRRYSFTTQGKNDDISYMVTAEKKKQDDLEYKDPKTGQVKTLDQTYFDQELVTMRLDKDLSSDRSLSMQFEHTNGEYGFGGILQSSGQIQHPDGYTTSKSNNIALTYQWGKDRGANDLFRFYHNEYESTSYSSLDDNVALTANGVNWQQSWNINETNSLVSGVDWRQEKLEDHVSINKDVTTSALFLEDRWKLPHSWTLSAGTRYDNHSHYGGKFTSRVSANREINSATNVYASWGQYVKNPTIAQMYSNTQWMKGNPGLQPETGETTMIGINTELGNGVNLQASAYHSRIKDTIDWAWKDWNETGPGTEYTKYVNIDDEERNGFDIDLTKQLSPQWNISGGYSYVKIESTSAREATVANRNSQPNGYRLNVEYDQDKWNSNLTVRRVTGRDLARFTSKSYTTLDMMVNYKINADTRVYLKGYNLTNEAYETIGGYWQSAPGEYPMPARSFYVGVEHKM
ncbi:TonB-dependent receptor plug domain-containing protein [Anaerospora hongkongensis]|uniref:TonB-dependent receptor plug domain-containing protein n=1 Tax=Anaerospora hongkongensis TaxID=244830 RepID=UPI00289D7AB8|nr:TonB-dependent receptor [Anaerospora hongkongensis]